MNSIRSKFKLQIGVTLISVGSILSIFVGTLPDVENYKFYFIILGVLVSVMGGILVIMQRIEDNEIKKMYPALIGGIFIIIMLVSYLLFFAPKQTL